MLEPRANPYLVGHEPAMAAFDAEMIERGATAVKQSLAEAEKSLDPEMVKGMLMATKGFTKTA